MFNKKIYLSDYLSFFIFIVLFIVGLLTYKDYGIGIDDKFHRLNGFYWLDYLLSFSNFDEFKIIVKSKLSSISDHTLPSIEYYNSYSIIFDVPAAFLEIIFKKNSPKEFYEFKHFLNFLFFYSGCLIFYFILRERFNRNFSLIGLILLTLCPRIYGESFYNMKDIIYLTFLSAAYLYCLKNFLSMNFKNLTLLALFSAICIQIRIFGLTIPFSFISFYLLSLLAKPKHLEKIYFLIFYIVATMIFTYLLWPYLWNNPLDNFLSTFKNIIPNVYVFFNGKYIDNEFLPYSYIPLWVLISTPILHLFLFIFGFYYMGKRIFNRLINIREKSISYDLWRSKREKFDAFLFLNFIVLFSLIVLLNLKLLNSWKHLYFMNFYIVYIGTFFLYILCIKKFKAKNLKYLISIFVIIAAFTTFRMYNYHPYQGLYFNSLVTDKFKNKFEIDFTALSVRHFLDKILFMEKQSDQINIGSATWAPLNRTLDIYSEDEKRKIKLFDQKYEFAKYIYTNNISEVDKNINNKYNIPNNFKKIFDLIVDGAIIYSVYKREKS